MTMDMDSARLLLGLNDKAGGDVDALVDLWDIPWHGLSETEIIALVQVLEQDGLVNCHRASASGTTTRITGPGVIKAKELARRRDSPAHRLDFAADTLIKAAMEAYPGTRVELQMFVGSRGLWFYDYVLELSEVDRAIQYLEGNSLVEVEHGTGTPVAFRLTPLGVQCGSRHPISVRTFVSEQNNPRPLGITFQGPVNGMQIGDYNSQHNSFGVDPGQLADFAQQVLAAATTMNVSPEVRGLIEDDATALEREAQRESPQPGRIRTAWETLRGSLVQASSDQAAQRLLELGSQLLS
ncbi:hypothetical protein OG345_42180 (plasmid) [Streptomyces sp. NBC_01220]|uniref:hypothetical protein n=1 Tax=Streptomyces sp. NBC_01220 TaxID=2903781 RepID=UPI00352C0DE3|nr:hypothetical protein OG345_42180 [Streptomyces sp. NBC_01220]